MAPQRRKVPSKIRKALVAEAGGKCANPGCSNRRTELHHIRQWAVYAAHDGNHMIALCPTCHDAVHGGSLRLDDETLYRWKAIVRREDIRDHVWVEPGSDSRLLLGSMTVQSRNPVRVFALSPHNQLTFRVVGTDVLLTSLAVSALDGSRVVEVTENTLRIPTRADVSYERRPGLVRVQVPATDEFVPNWALERITEYEGAQLANGRVVAAELHSEGPGLLRVRGVWAVPDRVVLISQSGVSFYTVNRPCPVILQGHGLRTTLRWEGPIDSSMFELL